MVLYADYDNEDKESFVNKMLPSLDAIRYLNIYY